MWILRAMWLSECQNEYQCGKAVASRKGEMCLNVEQLFTVAKKNTIATNYFSEMQIIKAQNIRYIKAIA